MRQGLSPEEQLRLALLDLQKANVEFVKHYGDPTAAETAARSVDAARTQAAHWGALVRGASRLEG